MEKKPEVKKPEVKDVKVQVFFDIRSAQIKDSEKAKLDELVKFLKENPGKKVSVSGYADKGTGNPNINKRYSEQRVKSIRDMLLKADISESRISAEAMGDTVQPFADNDSNRVCASVCLSKRRKVRALEHLLIGDQLSDRRFSISRLDCFGNCLGLVCKDHHNHKNIHSQNSM